MAGFKTFLLFVAVLIPFSAALSFEVSVDDELNSSEYDLEYEEEVEDLQTINLTFDNRGSIGCPFRLRAEFEQGNDTIERFSSEYPLWPGSTTDAELNYVPMNYTGEVETIVYSNYCEREQKVDSFSFEVLNSTVSTGYVESRTVEVDDRSAKVEFEEIDEGLLVPEEAPTFWKASGASVSEGSSVLTYEPPIFDSSRTIEYTVLDENNTVLGSTEVELVPDLLWTEELFQLMDDNAVILLAISLIVNVVLVFLVVPSARQKIKF